MRRSIPARLAALFIGLALSMAACGGGSGDGDGAASDADPSPTTSASSSGASGSSTIDVCDLLTDEEVETTLGLPVAKKEPGGGQGFATGACGWQLDTPKATAGTPDFTVSVKKPGGRAKFDILADQMPAVPGLGDDAYQQGDSLWAVEGDNLVILDFAFLTADVDAPAEAVPPLIEIVLSKL